MWKCAVVVAATMLVAVQSAVPLPPSGGKAYGEDCSEAVACQSVFTCSPQEHKCLCGHGQVSSSDKRTCLNAVQYGEVCTETAQCLLHVTDSVCGANKTCQCAEGFQHNASDDHRCVKQPRATPVPMKYGESCSPQEQCEKNFTCIDNTCKCPAGYNVSKDNLTCERDLKKYGEACSSSEECEEPFTNCKSQKCECPENRVVANNTKCVPVLKKYGEACSSSTDCRHPFINCKSQKCECPADHTISEDKMKCDAAAAGGPVTAQISAGLVMLACLYSFLLSVTSCDSM